MHKKIQNLFIPVSICLLFGISAQGQAPGPYDPQTIKINYVRTWDANAPIIDPASLMSRPLEDVKQITEYMDGLGRPIQIVIKKGSLETDPGNPFSSTNAVDLASPVLYDVFGRETYKYLSFASSGTNSSDGTFKMNPYQQQTSFMQQQYGAQGETFFYGQTNYEASPLNRVRQTMSAGNSWSGSNRGVEAKYWINTAADGVRIWTVTDNPGSFGTYSSSSAYAAGELFKAVNVDEQGKQTIEFKDKEGKTILKKMQLIAMPDDGNGMSHSNWLCTYYIYDDLDNLRCVIQPEGVKAISTSWSLTSSLLYEQCFRYEYNQRSRMIQKKIPGADEIRLVYY